MLAAIRFPDISNAITIPLFGWELHLRWYALAYIAGLIIGYVGVAFTAFLLIILFAIWGTAVSYSGY